MSRKGKKARRKGYPYHTNEPDESNVYHVRRRCPAGRDILGSNIRSGGYGRSLCKECQKLIYVKVSAQILPS